MRQVAKTGTYSKDNCNPDLAVLPPPVHRRVLNFLNAAVRPEDLMFAPPIEVHDEGNIVHEDNPHQREDKRKPFFAHDVAKTILGQRDREFPLGFRHFREVLIDGLFDRDIFDILLTHFSDASFGSWEVFPQNIPLRGLGTYQGVVHAAMLNTGKVLFITADETTLLWDPNDTTPSSFEDPVNQPSYSQLCGSHVFLSTGELLSMGGGGYGYTAVANGGFRFDPVAKTWTRTANNMSEAKWYPTAVALGDQRVLVTCGDRGGDMDVYNEATDSFSTITSGDDRSFPNLYPGLHLLPNHAVLYSRTGWGSAGAGGGGSPDNRSAYFTFTGSNTGVWTDIITATTNRTKGMSVLLLGSTPPYVQVLVLGGVDMATNNTYELLDASVLSPATAWGASIAFPDGEHRSLCNAVCLPDGTVFVCGGISRTNSPSTLFNPQAGTWQPMAALPSIRDYHSVALLLPSGQVMVAGWQNNSIEIFNPPYLFNGARPTITVAPALVHHGASFVIESPEAETIVRVVLVRPMAVTHQTDTEQKVIEMPYVHDHANPDRLTLTAPHGGHPHSIAQQGHYMMFAINNAGVPSVAKWIYLH